MIFKEKDNLIKQLFETIHQYKEVYDDLAHVKHEEDKLQDAQFEEYDKYPKKLKKLILKTIAEKDDEIVALRTENAELKRQS